MATIEKELADLRAKVAHPPKDVWDILGALSGLVSGVLVAGIGAYATSVYNRRQNALDEQQRRREEEQKEREIETLNIQTAERFLPYLAGDNERQKEAALAVLMLLAKGEFARRLALAFPGPGVLAAATRLTDPLTLAFANDVLATMFAPLRLSVVGVGVGWSAKAPQPDGWPNGVIVSGDGLVITAAGRMLDLAAEELFVELDTRQHLGARLQSTAADGRLTLLKAQGGSFVPWNLTPSPVEPGKRVIVIGHGVGQYTLTSATVLSAVAVEGQEPRLIITRIYMEGVLGAPVFDEDGLFVGLVERSDESLDVTFLIPASVVRDAFPDLLQ